MKDCDDKFALLYSVDTEIASRCRDGYYYGGRIYPKGWYKEEPNKYEKFMMSNLPRFESGSEGSTGIKVSRYWMDKIENKKHPVIAARRYEGIKRFDEAVWEDGDGSMHTKRLVQSYRNFLKTYPDFPFRAEIQLRIEELKKHTLDIKGELPPGV